MYIKRDATPILKKLSESYPVLVITGPRQSGKTTLTKHLFENKPYVSLEHPQQRAFALEDPVGFLEQFPNGVILDEVQHCPDLFSYIQTIVDEKRQLSEYILTGSQQFGLLSKISQSLAGRAGLLQLLPFSFNEISHAINHPFSLEELIFQGSYPPIYDRSIAPEIWYANYVNTYLERDVRQLINVKDLHTFQNFLRMCAARTGQLLNLSSIANDCGISHNTAKSWVSVLEASYIIFLLQPYHDNFNKRLIKSPKLYFIDTGLVCWLLNIQKFEQLLFHPTRGALFETWVISELQKARFNQGLASNLYFWRDSQGNEVDVLIQSGANLFPVEIKSGKTISSDYFAGINYWRKLIDKPDLPAWLIYSGNEQQKRHNIQIINWKLVEQINKS